MPEAIVPEPRLSVSLNNGGVLTKTEQGDQFCSGRSFFLYLTPAQAAQWAEVLTEHAKQVTA